jgi:hypothetical protein
MVQRCGDGRYQCLPCGKVLGDKTMARRHCEVHLDLTHACTLCHATVRTRNALSQHYRNVHNQKVSPLAL